MIILYILQFILAFTVLGLAAQFVVNGVDHFAKKLKVSSFSASFFILGLLTSLPEIGVGVSAVLDKAPGIYVGNLIGASFVLFLLAIPLLAIFGKGIKLSYQLTNRNLLLSLFVILAPTIFVLDRSVSMGEAIAMIILYLLLFYFIETKKKILEEMREEVREDIMTPRKHWVMQLAQIVVGCFMIFVASRQLVETIEYFAVLWGAPEFVISLIVLGVGTNLPEFSIAVTSILQKQKEVAFGDYVGSAAANTLLFGVLALFNGPFTLQEGNFFMTFAVFTIGMIFFYLFSRSQREISRQEGYLLLLIYTLFIILQVNY